MANARGLRSANLAHHSRLAGGLHVFDDLGNSVIFTARARIDQEFCQQAEDNKLNAGEQEKDTDKEKGAIADPMSLEPADHEIQRDEKTYQLAAETEEAEEMEGFVGIPSQHE